MIAVLFCGCLDNASNSGVLGSVILVAVAMVLRREKSKKAAGVGGRSGEVGIRGKYPDLGRRRFMLMVCVGACVGLPIVSVDTMALVRLSIHWTVKRVERDVVSIALQVGRSRGVVALPLGYV